MSLKRQKRFEYFVVVVAVVWLHFRADIDMRISLKVCEKLTVDDIIVENQGSICKIHCPDCDNVNKISSFVNKDTGRRTFTVANFTRHYEGHTGGVNENSAQIAVDGESPKQEQQQQVNDAKIANLEEKIIEKDAEIERVEGIITERNAEMKRAEKVMDELKDKIKDLETNVLRLEKEVTEKNNLIASLQKTVAEMKAQNSGGDHSKQTVQPLNSLNSSAMQKKVNQILFTVCLCAYEDVAGPDIHFNSNTVIFKGK